MALSKCPVRLLRSAARILEIGAKTEEPSRERAGIRFLDASSARIE